MFGNNPIRKPVFSDGSILAVQEIFPTFQGEGPYAGVPAIFLRLGGCNLACSFCDTEFESFNEQPLKDILETVATQANGSGARLVVITGGEPFRQPISALCTALVDAGFTVQVETNGLLYRDVPESVQIVCSPKAPQGNYPAIHGEILKRAVALKFLVSQYHEGYTTVPDWGVDERLYLQPIDMGDSTKNAENLVLARALQGQYGGKISLQIHKLAGVP